MPRILVIYGTTDGHTGKIARRLAVMLREYDVDVDVIRAGAGDVNPQFYAGIVVCASVHAGGYQRAVTKWVRKNATALSVKRTAFVSVCLGVLEKNPKVDRDLDAILERFFIDTGWRPGRVKRVAGALLYRQYGFLKRWIMKRIVAKAGGETDTSKDYEYTDWNDLHAFAEEFLRMVTPLPALNA